LFTHEILRAERRETVGMNIREAQERVALFDRQRGWEYSVKDTLLHLTEELGELTWNVRRPESTTVEKVEDEVADMLTLILHAANNLKIDAESAWLRKVEKDEKRFPVGSPARPYKESPAVSNPE